MPAFISCVPPDSVTLLGIGYSCPAVFISSSKPVIAVQFCPVLLEVGKFPNFGKLEGFIGTKFGSVGTSQNWEIWSHPKKGRIWALKHEHTDKNAVFWIIFLYLLIENVFYHEFKVNWELVIFSIY